MQFFTFTAASSPADAIHWPSGLNLKLFTRLACPLYVKIQPFLRISHNFKFLSAEPDARKSPYGWKSAHVNPALWPVNVLINRAASRSHIFKAPDADPATTSSSVCPNLTHSIGVVWPQRL